VDIEKIPGRATS